MVIWITMWYGHSPRARHSGVLKCALESIAKNKANGGGRIPAELFQILKYDSVKVLHSICQQIWKLSSGHKTGKGQFSKKSHAKECPNSCMIFFKLDANKVKFKILQVRFQHYVNWKLPDVQPGFRKDRGTRDQIANIHWIMENDYNSLKSFQTWNNGLVQNWERSTSRLDTVTLYI